MPWEAGCPVALSFEADGSAAADLLPDNACIDILRFTFFSFPWAEVPYDPAEEYAEDPAGGLEGVLPILGMFSRPWRSKQVRPL